MIEIANYQINGAVYKISVIEIAPQKKTGLYTKSDRYHDHDPSQYPIPYPKSIRITTGWLYRLFTIGRIFEPVFDSISESVLDSVSSLYTKSE